MPTSKPLIDLAQEIFRTLKKRRLKLVLAESCTGGLVAAAFTSVPGVGNVFCGSQVTYRTPTKQEWLGIPKRTLQTLTPVSQKVARLMATRILMQTPEAAIAASITGHLGPKAPKQQDGLVFTAIAVRAKKKNSPPLVFVAEHHLPRASRLERQRVASQSLLEMVRSLLSVHSESKK